MIEPTSDSLVYIVEDDEAMRDSLAMLLEASGYAVGFYATGEACLAEFDARKATCVLVDLKLPGMDGITLHRRLAAAGNIAPCIVLTAHGDVTRAVAAMKAGVAEFIEKPFDPAQIIALVENARTRNRSLRGSDVAIAAMQARLSQLTARETEVLEMVANGHSNKSIADALEISPRTVEVHRARAMLKIQARSVAEVVRLFVRQVH